MKIAISGKGGVGKTTISGTLCRLLGQKGLDVLAIDGDPNPNLAVVLGLASQEPPPLGANLLERVEENGVRRVQLGSSLEEVLRSYAIEAPDNVMLLMLGKPDHAGTGCMCSSHAVVREVVHAAVTTSERVTVLDMEASLEHMKRGTSKYVDALYIVAEPYFRSLEAARRLKELAEELGIEQIVAIANKVRSEEDEQAVREYCERIDLTIAAIIPFDEHVMQAERERRTLIDMNGRSPALLRLRELADRIAPPR